MSQSLRWYPEIGRARARVMSALSYAGILCFVPLLFGQDDEIINVTSRKVVLAA